MNSLLPPTALYVILALAVTVTARVTDKDVRQGALLQQRPWLVGLLHVPVLMAWGHVAAFLACQLAAPKVSFAGPEYMHLVIHTVVFGLVGIVCGCTYVSQIRHRRFDSGELEASSP